MDELDSGQFATHLLRVIDEGQKTGTQKLILLLAILDEVDRRTGTAGAPPERLHIPDVCDRIVDIMWQQVAPYVPPGGTNPVTPRQMRKGKGPQTFGRLVQQLREVAAEKGVFLPSEARDLPDYRNEVRPGIRSAARKNPIPRLQTVGHMELEFLYERDSWRSSDELAFVPGAREHLWRLGPVLRPIIQQKVVELVATYNGWGDWQTTLRSHLFESSRTSAPPEMRCKLKALDRGCFYCGKDAGSDETQLDHFIAWHRMPNDAVQNLVASCRACNNAKRVLLSAPDFVRSWMGTMDRRTEIGERFEHKHVGVFSDRKRTVSVAVKAYWMEHNGAPLWAPTGQSVLLTQEVRDEIQRLLRPE